MPYKQYALQVLEIARQAGELIMEYYSGETAVMIKEDESPVTPADMAANKLIVKQLQSLTPDIPIVAEETPKEINNKALDSDLFWIVDPLDGTTSYIKRKGQFTVNIAMIDGRRTIGGVIYVPRTKESYFVGEDGKAYKQEASGDRVVITVRNPDEDGLIIVSSITHGKKETDEYIATLGDVKSEVSASSSLKFCLVAEGKADLYPRMGATMEWDTAAGQAILEAAGGRVENLDGTPFRYRKEGFLNPYFIAKG